MLFVLENVSYTRGERRVISELTVTIGDGTTAMVGPSGAGKSTLLRLLNRLADPGSGTIRYRGRDLRDYDVLELRREVALVPQLPALLPDTVAENLRFGPRLAGRTCDITQALALNRAVLLLDEPTAALDQHTRDAVERTLIDLRDRLSVSLVLVTHDRDQAHRLSDRIIGLDHGQLRPQPT
jgi:putative ABC transport system ATP-binding protein